MKSRLLFIFNHRPNRGGLSGQVEELIYALRGEGFEVEIASTYGRPDKRLVKLISALIKCFRSDVIFGIGSAFRGMLPMVVAGIGSRISGRPVIYNFHDGQAVVFLDKFHRWTRRLVAGKPLVTATEYVADAFRSRNVYSTCIPCHFNFETSLYEPGSTNKSKSKILWAREFNELYQPELMLRAAMIALDINPDIEFHLYGDGRLLEEMQRKYRHDAIRFHGRLPRDQFLKEYAQYSILVNTTAYDNFPMSIVEAGYNELLVISTRIGGIASLYDDSEILFFEDGNAEQLASLICKVVADPETFGDHKNKLHEKVVKFRWEKVRQDWLGLIETTLK